MLKFICFTLSFIFIFACTSTSSLRKDYLNATDATAPSQNHHTYFVFLIDGLGYNNFIAYQKQMPNTLAYFQPKPGQNLSQALTVIPSLTFPNIASLLTGEKIYRHNIVGNKMLAVAGEVQNYGGNTEIDSSDLSNANLNNSVPNSTSLGSTNIDNSSLYDPNLKNKDPFQRELINWEDPLSKAQLNQKLGSFMLFNTLSETGRSSLSLAHYFSEGATAHLQDDLQSAKNYLTKDYFKIDRKTLFSMEKFIKDVPQSQWPHFILIHLVSFDFASHDLGPNHKYVQEQLNNLDLQLGRIYDLLASNEQQNKNIVSLLTSDHGFVDTPNYLDLNELYDFSASNIRLLNQSRAASLYFPTETSNDKIAAILKTVSKDKRITLVSQKSLNGFNLIINGVFYSFKFSEEICNTSPYSLVFRGGKFCPEDAEQEFSVKGSKYLVEQLSAYHRAKESADAIIFAAPGINFDPKQLGGHGGLSKNETQSLILLRNANLTNASDHFYIENVLDFIATDTH